MQRFDEKFLLKTIYKKVAEAERRAFLFEALREQKGSTSFRQRLAHVLVKIANWLTPDPATSHDMYLEDKC